MCGHGCMTSRSADGVQEDLSNEPVLKVWALDKPVKKTGLPTCQSTLSIQNGRKPFPVSALADKMRDLKLILCVDICVLGPGRPFAVGGRFREWICDGYKRRLGTRSRRETENCSRIRGTDYWR